MILVSNFTGGPTNSLKNSDGSLTAEHLMNNREYAKKFSVEVFLILSKSFSSFHLKVFETIHILFDRPSLSKQRECLLGHNIISI